MKKFVIQTALLVLVTFAALAFATKQIPNFNFFPTPISSKQISVGSVRLSVELADSASKRKKGLGGRDSLDEGSGMLFVFQSPVKSAFWMKGVKFSLDMIWIKENTVVDIIKNAQAPAEDVLDSDLPRYVPNQPIDMVLEVNAGFVDKHGIKIGDKLEIVN